MPTRTRVRRVRAGFLALVLVLAGLGGCAPGDGAVEGASTTPTSPRPFDGRPVLHPWFEAVRGSDTEAANIVVLGDSVSEGSGLDGHLERRWIDRLQAQLRDRAGAPACSTSPGGHHGTTSLVPADYRASSLPDPRVQGSATPEPEVGPGGRSLALAPGASVTWQVEATSVDIGYRLRTDGGLMQIEIDGTSRLAGVAVPTVTDGAGGRRVWSSGQLGEGEHTVTVRNDTRAGSDRQVTVSDLTPFRGDRDRCVHVLDASRTGVTARTITETPGYLADSLSLGPDLLLVPLGFNDAGAGIAPDDFGHVLDTLIDQTRAQGYDGPVLLVGWFTPAWHFEAGPWADYLEQMRTRTSHAGVSFIDLSAVLAPADPDSPNYLDGAHPSAAGQKPIADSLIEPLAPRAESADEDEG